MNQRAPLFCKFFCIRFRMTRKLYLRRSLCDPLTCQAQIPYREIRILREMLNPDGYFQLEPAPFAERCDVELIHDAEVCRSFHGWNAGGAAMRRIGFPWSEMLVKRTMASVGGTLAATDQALASGWGGTLAGGTHHAFAAGRFGILRFQ